MIASSGGNKYASSASGCEFKANEDGYGTAATFGLSLGTFGGELEVLGWSDDGLARPQVGFGRSPYCIWPDIRRLPRSGDTCDSGALEQH